MPRQRRWPAPPPLPYDRRHRHWCGALRRRSCEPGRGRPAAHGPRHLRRRHLPAGDAARLLRPQPLRPGGDSWHRHLSRPCGSRGPGRVHRGRPQRCGQEQWHTSVGPDEPGDPPAPAGRGRGALRRRPGRAGRGREPLPGRGRRRAGRRRLRGRCRRSSTTPSAEQAERARARAPRLQPDRRDGGPARLGPARRCSLAPPTSSAETIYQQAYVPVPDGGARPHRRLLAAPPGELTIYSATQAPARGAPVLLPAARHARAPVRVIMRDTGGGFGQKIMVQRDEMCIMLAAPKIGRPAEVGGGPAGEPARRRPVPPRARRGQDGLRRRGDHPGRPDRLRLGLRGLPDPVAGRDGLGGRRRCSRAPTGSPGPASPPSRSTPTPSAGPRTAGPGSSSRWPARCCSTSRPGRWAWTRWSCGGATCCAATSCPTPTPTACPSTASPRSRRSSRRWRCSTTRRSGREQAEARAAGRYLGVGLSTYVEPSTPGFGYYATEAATIRIEPSGKVNVYIAGGSTGNSIETTVVQLTADALGVDIEDVATIQGDTALTGFGAGAAGSRSGSMTAGAIRETAAILRERIVAIAAHKLEAAAGGHRAGRQPGQRAGHARPSACPSPSWPASPTSTPYALPPGVPAGLEASARYTADDPLRLGQRHPPVHLRGRRRHRPGRGSCATS